MTESHHDANLCRRLAIKLGIGERVHYQEDDPDSGYYEDERGREIDFCCNPAHSWMLVQKLAELGYFFRCDTEDMQVLFFYHTEGNLYDQIPRLKTLWKTTTTNLLYATALAAAEVTK